MRDDCGSVRMRLRVLVPAAALCLGAICVAGAQGDSHVGKIGGPPYAEPSNDGGAVRISPTLVIGTGETFDGPVELIAYGSILRHTGEGNRQFCVWSESPGRLPEFETCADPRWAREGPVTVASESRYVGQPKSEHATVIGGILDPDVATVRVSYLRGGKRERVRPVLAHVTGDLRKRLKQTAPWGYYTAAIRGFVRFTDIRVTAFDKRGRVLGHAVPLPF